MLKLFEGSIARNTVKTTLVFGLRLAAQASTLICLTRLLGPAGFGEYSAIAALAVLMGTVSSLGTHIVLLGETAISPERRTKVLCYALPTTIFFGTLLLFLYSGATALFFDRIYLQFFVIFFIGISEIIFQPLNQLACGELQGLGKAPLAHILLTVPLLLRVLILIFLLLTPVANPLEVFSMGYVCSTALTLYLFQHYLPGFWPHYKFWKLPTIGDIKNTIGYALLNLTTNGTSEIDKAISTHLLGLSVAGIYTTGSRIIGAISLPIIAMSTAAMPRIFRENDTCSTKSALLQHTMFLIAGIYGICAGFALWLSAPLLVFLFGEKFEFLPHIMKWLAFAVPAICLRLAAGTFFMGTKRPWLRGAIECSGIFIFLALSPTLSHSHAETGFLIAYLISEWTMALVSWVQLIKNPLDTKTIKH